MVFLLDAQMLKRFNLHLSFILKMMENNPKTIIEKARKSWIYALWGVVFFLIQL